MPEPEPELALEPEPEPELEPEPTKPPPPPAERPSVAADVDSLLGDAPKVEFQANAIASLARKKKAEAEQVAVAAVGAPPAVAPRPATHPPVPAKPAPPAATRPVVEPAAATPAGKKEDLLLWAQRLAAQGSPSGTPKPAGFQRGFGDGVAFCAILCTAGLLEWSHVVTPGGGWEDGVLDAEERLRNLELAFGVAESELGLSQLLDADDMAEEERYDEKSVMTYLGELRKRLPSRDGRGE